MSLFFHIAAGLCFAGTVCCIFHCLYNMRSKAERTMLWIAVMMALPGIGWILYLCFGFSSRAKFKSFVEEQLAASLDVRKKLPCGLLEQTADSQIRFSPDASNFSGMNPETLIMLDRIFPEQPLLTGNDVRLICNGDRAYPEMIHAIESAKHFIHIQSFIIADDSVGKAIFDALERQAAKGVLVRVIYDKFGSFHAIRSHFFRRYSGKSPNLEIHAFSRLSLWTPWRIQLRNHRKLLIVDGKTAFIGGLNISADNFRIRRRKVPPIRDLHCCVMGPAVMRLQMSFLNDWCIASHCPPEKVFDPEMFPVIKETSGTHVLRVIPSGYGCEQNGTEKVFFTAAACARRSLWIMTPYFVPDLPFLKALRTTSMRGVEVRIVLPEKNNHKYMFLASRSLYESLLEDGVRIFERRGSFSHAKAMLVDGEWCYFGSSNCDVRSFRLNYELDLLISSGSFLQDLHGEFRKAFLESREITLENLLKKQSIPARILENICALFTPIL